MLLANFNQKEHLRHRAVLLAAAQLSCCILAATVDSGPIYQSIHVINVK